MNTPAPDATPSAQPQPAAPASKRVRTALLSANDRRLRRRKWITYGILIISGGLMVNALVGETGYLATIRARSEYNAVLESLIRIRLENQALVEEARRLREDPAALEEAARRELGMTRPGERLVIVRDAAPGGPAK